MAEFMTGTEIQETQIQETPVQMQMEPMPMQYDMYDPEPANNETPKRELTTTEAALAGAGVAAGAAALYIGAKKLANKVKDVREARKAKKESEPKKGLVERWLNKHGYEKKAPEPEKNPDPAPVKNESDPEPKDGQDVEPKKE